MTSLYVASLAVMFKDSECIRVVHTVWGTINAHSDFEAHGMAHAEMMRRWPQDAGYSGHTVRVMEVPLQMILEVAKQEEETCHD